MTGLPKDLIACIKRSSGYSDEHPAKRAHPERFKECMRNAKEHRNKSTPDKDLSEDAECHSGQMPAPFFVHADTSNGLCAAISPSAVDSNTIRLVEEVQALFEKMASMMIMTASAQSDETTVFLDSPQFASSSFFGTRITIKEFSTAPKIFNIEIASHQAGLNLLSTHKDALLAAFESHKLPFAVHRLDTELLSGDLEKHAFQDDTRDRKEDDLS